MYTNENLTEQSLSLVLSLSYNFPSLVLSLSTKSSISFDCKTQSVLFEDSIPLSAKHLQKIEQHKHRHQLQREIINIAKNAIKPSYKNGHITKDTYKIIMKKVVDKATSSNKLDRQWIEYAIDFYVRKYRT